MPDAGSVTHWFNLLRAGDGAAAQPLWERYFADMVRLARRHLAGRVRAAADEEDVALKAFDSFCRDALRGRYPRLDGRDGLWRLLLSITAQKAIDLMRAEGAAKRGAPLHTDAIEQAIGREPSPDFAASVAEECERLLSRLDDEELRPIAVWKMEGHTNDEIAAILGCTPRTVERRLAVIRALWGGSDPTETTDDHARPSTPAGERAIPGYEVLEELARGGMGVVHVARHAALNRTVAVKSMLAGPHATPEQRMRFRIEAEAMARLSHPNIVQVFEVGEHGGTPFFAMELAAGGSLAGRLDGRPWEPRPAAELARTLARAVQHAHEKGIIHRDLKPANILFDAADTPKITDFGLARRIDAGAGPTVTGDIFGTPAYMPPEQARGDRVGPAADVYGLGAILYELLTGHPPFTGPVYEVLIQVQSREPAPPRRLRPHVPPDLEAICLKCLEKDPARRYASAAALADDLDNFQAGRPTDRPDSAWRRLESELYFRNVALAEREWSASQPQRADQLLDACRPDLRGWEWHCLKGLRRGRLLTLSGHEDVVYAVAFSPDGQRLLTASDDQTLRLWDPRTGAHLRTIAGPTDQIYTVCFSPDGGRVAAACQAGVVRVWCLESGTVVHELRGHSDVVVGVAYSPDGTRIASASDDGTVRLWDAASGAAVRTLRGHEGFVNSVAFSPDGSRLASASNDRTVRLWDAATGEPGRRLTGHDAYVWCVAFSPDGGRVAAGGGDRSVRVWDPWTGQELGTLQGHTGAVLAVVFHPGGTRLASAGEDKMVRIWDVTAGQEAVTLRGHADEVKGLAISPDGVRLASASDDRTVKVWDATEEEGAGPAVLLTARDHAGPVRGVAFAPDGRRLASCGDDLSVRVWDAHSGAALHALRGHEALVTAVAFSPDGTRLASAAADKTLRVWPLAGGEPAVLRGHADRIYRVAFSPDGTRLASAAWDRTVRLWDAATGREVFAPLPHGNWVWGVAFSPDGRLLVSSGTDRLVRVWDAATGEPLAALGGHVLKVLGVAFGPCGRVIASAGGDQSVRLWGWPGGAELAVLEGHAGRVYKVAFSPDGALLASAGEDQTVRVWDVRTGRERLVLRGHTRQVNDVAFRPDGSALASASDDGTVKVWDLGPKSA